MKCSSRLAAMLLRTEAAISLIYLVGILGNLLRPFPSPAIGICTISRSAREPEKGSEAILACGSIDDHVDDGWTRVMGRFTTGRRGAFRF